MGAIGTLYWLNEYGVSLTNNKKTLKFYHSHLCLSESPNDYIYFAHEICEKF